MYTGTCIPKEPYIHSPKPTATSYPYSLSKIRQASVTFENRELSVVRIRFEAVLGLPRHRVSVLLCYGFVFVLGGGGGRVLGYTMLSGYKGSRG